LRRRRKAAYGGGPDTQQPRSGSGFHEALARYTVQTPTGRKRNVIYAKSHEEARKKLAGAIAERDKGLVYDSGNVTLEEYLGRWLEDSVRGSVKVTTHAGYERVARLHVCPALGARSSAPSPPSTSRRSTAPSSRRDSHPRA
jgi:integrase